MGYFTSVLFIFLIVFLLVLCFHLYYWDSSWSSVYGFRSWVSSFECGFLSQRLVENYFSYTYFALLVFFVIFDLEVSLLLNMPLQGMMFKNLTYYFSFISLIAFGFSAEIGKGYVEWAY